MGDPPWEPRGPLAWEPRRLTLPLLFSLPLPLPLPFPLILPLPSGVAFTQGRLYDFLVSPSRVSGTVSDEEDK